MGRRAEVESGSLRLEAETWDPPEAHPTHQFWLSEGELKYLQGPAKTGLLDWLAEMDEEGADAL